MSDIIQQLKNKRKEIAAREGKELFMILSNATIDAMAAAMPKNKAELIQVKGWGEKKIQMYGMAFLEVLHGGEIFPEEEIIEKEESTGPKQIKIQIGQEQLSLLGGMETKKKASKKIKKDTILSSRDSSTEFIPTPVEGLGMTESEIGTTKNEIGAIENMEGNIPAAELLPSNTAISVSEFLGNINRTLATLGEVKIKGEMGDVQVRNGYAFFELKDSLGGFEPEASMGCFVGWKCFSEVKHLLENGFEVVISGIPKIYLKNGSFRLEVTNIEAVGEGALQKAFEALQRKLEEKGYFNPARKRPIPASVRTIGLITSVTGAVIVDFKKNLGSYGFQVQYIDVRVEGDQAEDSIIQAVRRFNEQKVPVDVLVLIRGGGSLQSLKAFNSEKVVDAIYYSRIPLITGIGHDRDETIAGFTSDFNCSTPTAVANFLRSQHEALQNTLTRSSNDLFLKMEFKIRETQRALDHETQSFVSSFEKIFLSTHSRIHTLHEKLRYELQKIFISFHTLEKNFLHAGNSLMENIRKQNYQINLFLEKTRNSYQKNLTATVQRVALFEEKIKALNPEAVLKRGYSILCDTQGKVVKSPKNIEVGQKITARLYEGKIFLEVKEKEV